MRKPFEGLTNILRFNRHFYLLALTLLVILFILTFQLKETYSLFLIISITLISLVVLNSLIATYFIYDLSNLYTFDWLQKNQIKIKGTIVNIHAGFDETSSILKEKFPESKLIIYDFYDPQKHTEISIKRARKFRPLFPGTLAIQSGNIPLTDESVDTIFVTFAAHEIRNEAERMIFFKELNRILKDDGQIILTEHLRDLPNFLAFTIGFFHFLPRKAWKKIYQNILVKEFKITPFVHTFILHKNGTTS